MESVVLKSAVPVSTKTGGGWSKLSTLNKGLIIFTGLVIVSGIVYFGFIRKKDEKLQEGGASKGGDDKKSGSGSETKDTTKSTITEVEKEVKTSTPSSTNITKTTTTSTTTHDIRSLPNSGKGCGQVHTNFDRDFDYVKCGGSWWTKSKPTPATPSKKGAIPEWKSLAANKIATERLNARYTKG